MCSVCMSCVFHMYAIGIPYVFHVYTSTPCVSHVYAMCIPCAFHVYAARMPSVRFIQRVIHYYSVCISYVYHV